MPGTKPGIVGFTAVTSDYRTPQLAASEPRLPLRPQILVPSNRPPTTRRIGRPRPIGGAGTAATGPVLPLVPRRSATKTLCVGLAHGTADEEEHEKVTKL